MGNQLYNLFGYSQNIQNQNSIPRVSSIRSLNSLDKEKLFSIPEFKQHYIMNLANVINKNIILLGDSKIGKTKIFNTIFGISDNNEQKSDRKNNYAYFQEKIFIIDGLEINLNVWDTPGGDEHKESNKHFIKDCIIIYLCFNYNNSKSYENIKKYYIKNIKEVCGKNGMIVVVGIKNEVFENEEGYEGISVRDVNKFTENGNYLFYNVCLDNSNSINFLFDDSIKKYVLMQSKLTFSKK